MISVLKKLLGAPVEIAATYFTRRAELKDAKHSREIDQISQGRRDDVELSKIDIANAGWKDEFWTIVLATPFIGAFIPGLQPYMREGFAVISEYPTWAQYYLGVSVLTAFGWRSAKAVIKRDTTQDNPINEKRN